MVLSDIVCLTAVALLRTIPITDALETFPVLALLMVRSLIVLPVMVLVPADT